MDVDDGDTISSDVMDKLIAYLVRTYYHMRGKDFYRQIMATEFGNLGKGIHPTLARLFVPNRTLCMNTNYLKT